MSLQDPPTFYDERIAGQNRRGRGDHAGALAHFRAAGALKAGERWNRNDIALSLLALDRHDEAEADARSLAADAPDFAPVHRTLGLIARAKGDREAALGHFRTALRHDGQGLWNRHDVAVELKELGRLGEADAAYRSVADATPFAHSLRGMGSVARAQGKHERALGCFAAASLLMPADPWFALDVAATLRALKRFDEADSACEAMTLAHPTFLPGFRERAALARERGDFEAAERHLEAALGLAPDDAALGRELAETLTRLGRGGDAETIFARMLVQRPGSFEAFRGLARLARERGEREAAVAHLRAAAGSRPDEPSLHAELSGDFLALGRIEEAEASARTALALDPANDRARRCLALAAKAAGRPTEALALGWERWRANEANSAAGFDLAEDLREFGRRDLAERLYETLSQRPDVAATALIEMAACRRKGGDVAAAREMIERARALEPEHPRALLMLADDRRDRGDLAEADSLYDRALAARPGFYWALVGKAITAFRKAEPDAARTLLGQAIAADPAEGFAQIELANDLSLCADTAGARAVLASVPATSRRVADAMMALGHIHRLCGDFTAAAAAFAAVVQRFPDHVEALIEQAEDELRVAKGMRAAVLIETARETAPEHPAVLEALARRALIRDDLDTAQGLYRQVTQIDPLRLWPHLALARIEAMLGDIDAAFARLDAAKERFGPRPDIALGAADLARQTGDPARARAILSEARAAFPHDPRLCHQQAMLDIDTGRFRQAETMLTHAPARTLPDKGRLAFARSLLAAARFDFTRAIEEGERAVAALPGDGWVRNRLIHASLLHLDIERAGRHLDRLAELEASANRLRGKSANRSQSHYGQIFDEFRLDGETLGELQSATALPDGARLAALGAVARRNPDSTAAAILFFIEQRRAGLLARTAPAEPSKGVIPRQIHQYWDDGAPPADIARYMATWRTAHPGFGHHVWREETARAFLKKHAGGAVLAAYDRAVEPAMKADLFRLALLKEIGGIYADADDRCLQNLGPLLARDCDMVVYQEDLGSLGNNLIAAAPQHPIVGRALDLATQAVNRGDSDILWLSTGPGLLTRAAAEVCLQRPEVFDRLMVLERHECLASVSIHCLAAYKATERHWSRTAFGGTRAKRSQATSARSAS